MKLISLNIWGGRITEPLLKFINDNSATEIFCFQEVLKGGKGKTVRNEPTNIFEEISEKLPNHKAYFYEYQEAGYGEKKQDRDYRVGISCFVDSKLRQRFVEGIHLYEPGATWSDYSGRFAAGSAMLVEVEDFAVVNIHGIWQGSIKKDTEAKIAQSKKIMGLAEKSAGKKIVCGDFNLLPDTQAIQMFQNIYSDLIRDFDIKSTRSSMYTYEIRHCDYLFADKSLKVKSFAVPEITISDHLPLIFEF